jgi:hypothetical protein
MKTRRVIALSVFAGATFSAAVGLSVASEDTQTAPGATASPLALAKDGYFFVGGQYVESQGKRLMAGQCM